MPLSSKADWLYQCQVSLLWIWIYQLIVTIWKALGYTKEKLEKRNDDLVTEDDRLKPHLFEAVYDPSFQTKGWSVLSPC